MHFEATCGRWGGERVLETMEDERMRGRRKKRGQKEKRSNGSKGVESLTKGEGEIEK